MVNTHSYPGLGPWSNTAATVVVPQTAEPLRDELDDHFGVRVAEAEQRRSRAWKGMVGAVPNTVTLGAEVWALDLALMKPVTTAAEAHELLEALAGAGVTLERLDDVEPVRRSYGRETIEDIFAAGPSELPCRTLIGRGKKNQGFVSARFCRPVELGGGSVNIISVQTGRQRPQVATGLASTAEKFLADGRIGWGFVDRWEVYQGQRMPGTINDRLDGVFWANAYSTAYIEALGEDHLLSVPWARTKRTPGGIMTWLYGDPGVLPRDLIERRHEARRAIGEERFLAGRWEGLPQLGRNGPDSAIRA